MNNNSKPFTCPECRNKLPFIWSFNLSKHSVMNCPNCQTKIAPKNVKDFTPFFIAGILLTVIPVQVYLRYKDDIIEALLLGTFSGGTGIISVVFYVYKSTIFDFFTKHNP